VVQRAFGLGIIAEPERTNCFIRIPIEEPMLVPEIIKAYRWSLGYSDYEFAKMVGLTQDTFFERFGAGRSAWPLRGDRLYRRSRRGLALHRRRRPFR
jgi:hypothetical protein